MQLANEKCKYLEIAEMKKDYQKMKYQSNPEIEEQKKKSYQENPKIHKKIQKIMYQKCQKKKKCWDKVENFLQQVKQGSYHIYKICLRSL